MRFQEGDWVVLRPECIAAFEREAGRQASPEFWRTPRRITDLQKFLTNADPRQWMKVEPPKDKRPN